MVREKKSGNSYFRNYILRTIDSITFLPESYKQLVYWVYWKYFEKKPITQKVSWQNVVSVCRKSWFSVEEGTQFKLLLYWTIHKNLLWCKYGHDQNTKHIECRTWFLVGGCVCKVQVHDRHSQHTHTHKYSLQFYFRSLYHLLSIEQWST